MSLMTLLGTAPMAQEAKQGASPVVALDVSAESLKNNPLAAFIGLPANSPVLGIMNAKRFYAAMSLPKSVDEFTQMGPGVPIPLEMLVVGEFASKEDRSRVLRDEQAENMELVTINSKEYRTDPIIPNAYLLLEESRFEIGTEKYITATRSALLATKLKQAMAELGKAPAKLVVDFDSQRDFFLSAIDMIKQQGAPPLLTPFLDLPKRIDLLQVALDPQANEMLTLMATCKNPEDAAYVSKSLTALVDMAKLGMNGAPKNQAGPELISKLLASTRVSSSGNKTTLLIIKPDNFDADMTKAMGELQQASKKMQGQNNFKQALLAVHNYHDAYRAMPFRHTADGRFSDKLSWRVRVLPFIEQAQLYEKFAVGEAWDSDNNKPLARDCPAMLGEKGKTAVCWIESDVTSFRDITDGTSNTICLIENPALVDWTSPKDITIENAKKLVKGLPDGKTIIIGMYDGSVRQIDNTIDADLLHAKLTPNGGERIE
jgi:hypothetical protein